MTRAASAHEVHRAAFTRHKTFFIKGAIQHPGSLHRFAAEHGALKSDGTIDLAKAERAAMRLRTQSERTRRVRQINLARSLKSFNP